MMTHQIWQGRLGGLGLIMILAVVVLVSAVCFYVLDVKPEPDTSHLKTVKFKIVDEATGEPLKNRELNICRAVEFKLKRGAPSPYLKKEADWFITSIKTDGQGVFFLDLFEIEASSIVVEPGPPYDIVRFERSSDIAHMKSADHIRVVQFKPETTQVVSNKIYDLKRQIVKTIPISGQPEERPYEEIVLVATSNQWAGHTRPDKWEKARVFHTSIVQGSHDWQYLDERIFVSRVELAQDSRQKVFSPHKVYWYFTKEDLPEPRHYKSTFTINIFNERDYLVQVTFKGINKNYVKKVNWINEKLLYIQIWWGRVLGTYLVFDVEKEKIIYREMVHDGGIPFLQWQQSKDKPLALGE